MPSTEQIKKERTRIERGLACALLADDYGITIRAYELLLKTMNCEDSIALNKQVKKQDGRVYLPPGHTIPIQWI